MPGAWSHSMLSSSKAIIPVLDAGGRGGSKTIWALNGRLFKKELPSLWQNNWMLSVVALYIIAKKTKPVCVFSQYCWRFLSDCIGKVLCHYSFLEPILPFGKRKRNKFCYLGSGNEWNIDVFRRILRSWLIKHGCPGLLSSPFSLCCVFSKTSSFSCHWQLDRRPCQWVGVQELQMASQDIIFM